MTDKELILKYQGGDKSAFREIYERYAERVKYFVYGMIRSREDAEDVMQDTFSILVTHHNSYDPSKGKFTTWLFSIAKHEALEFQRKRKVHVRAEYFESEALKDVQFAGGVDIINEPSKQILSGLPDHYKDSLWLYGQGYKYKEIAQILDISINTVKTRIHRGRKYL